MNQEGLPGKGHTENPGLEVRPLVGGGPSGWGAPLARPSQARLTCSLSKVLSGDSLSQMGADSLGQVQDVL